MKRGKFIVIEGINGCGKGTQLERLVGLIHGADKYSTIFVTREPNNFDKNGIKAREMLAQDGDPYKNAESAVEYFARNRQFHNAQFILPMIEKGIHVVSDRYWYSNFAFQHAQGIPYEKIAEANRRSRSPELTLIIDVPAEVAAERLIKRDGEQRRKFDNNIEFLEKVRQNYLELPEVLPSLIQDRSIVLIKGNRDIEAVWEDIKDAYSSAFKSC
ncbi:MAG: dTMP kinase [Candidatus Pacearchaeota archaeon]